ncbi:MAG: NnrS family protein [Myxococcaceae bacterium]|nr:NnrS family protein [Myxococcaceae bacterium]
MIPSPVPDAAPAWFRKGPYLIFYPIGGALSLMGVLPWAFYAAGWGTWRPGLHALTEVQGALVCFAIGFLFTFVPRRTGAALPTALEISAALALVAPPPVLSLLHFERAAHAAWALLAAFLCGFVLSRIPGAVHRRLAVAQLMWLPTSFGLAAAGALMMALAGAGRPVWFAPLGSALVWQGMLGGLVTGIGGMLLPMLLHREPHRGNRSTVAWWLHGAACAVFAASFGVDEAVGLRTGYALRGAVVLAVLCVTARLWRPPRVEGVHRWAAWFAAWMVPAGFLAVAVWPTHRVDLLHLTFLSGFTLLTLSVANHVTIAHGGRDALLCARPVPLRVMFLSVVLATVARLMVTIDPARVLVWLGTAFSLFAVALGAWAVWVLPHLRPVPGAVDRPVEPSP